MADKFVEPRAICEGCGEYLEDCTCAMQQLRRDLAVAQAQLAVVRAWIKKYHGPVQPHPLAAAMDEAAEKVRRGA